MSVNREIKAVESYLDHLDELALEIDECGDWDDLPGIARERESAEAELENLRNAASERVGDIPRTIDEVPPIEDAVRTSRPNLVGKTRGDGGSMPKVEVPEELRALFDAIRPVSGDMPRPIAEIDALAGRAWPALKQFREQIRNQVEAEVRERLLEEIAQELDVRAEVITTDPLNAGETPEARVLLEVASFIRNWDGFPQSLQAAVEKALRLPNRTPITFAALDNTPTPEEER